MFTGIIQHVGLVRTAGPAGRGARLVIDVGPLAELLTPGRSIAVNGACLTAAAVTGAEADFDAVAETLARTTLGRLRAATRVNLEPAVQAGGRLDGHIVQGHVDGTAEVASVKRGDQRVVELVAETALTDQMVPKGSVAVDGVSLTLVDVSDGRFSVALVPTTLEATTLGDLAAGQAVNVETDVIGKCVLRYLRRLSAPAGGGLSLEKLKEAGFL